MSICNDWGTIASHRAELGRSGTAFRPSARAPPCRVFPASAVQRQPRAIALPGGERGDGEPTSQLTTLLDSGLENIACDGPVRRLFGVSSTSSSISGSGLQSQIQSAVATALEAAEQSGSSDLKSVVYDSLVQVLNSNGIDPKTLQPTGSSANGTSSGSQAVDSNTGSVLSQVMAALTAAGSAANPAQLLSPSGSQTSSNTLSLLGTSSASNTTDSLTQLLAANGDSQSVSELSSLLSDSQSGTASTTALSSLFGSQNNSQDPLGFLFDSAQ